MPRGRRTVAQQAADARRRVESAERHVEEADAELQVVEKRFRTVDRRVSELLDKLVDAQAEQDTVRRERYRLREWRRKEAERAARQRMILGVLEERRARGER